MADEQQAGGSAEPAPHKAADGPSPEAGNKARGEERDGRERGEEGKGDGGGESADSGIPRESSVAL